jgi:Glycine rich protein/PEP-CTERM motif
LNTPNHMKTKQKFSISSKCHSFSTLCMVAVTLLFGVLAGSAQTGRYVYTGAEQTITLGPGLYDITAYGAQGGNDNYASEAGGLGAEMEGQFSFTSVTTLILLVGGVGGLSTDAEFGTGAGGGGGSFVVDGSTPLVIAGGGGGAGQQNSGANTGTSGSAGGFIGNGGVGGGAGGINGGGGGGGSTEDGDAGGGGGYSGAGGGFNGGQSFLSGGGVVGNGGFGGGGSGSGGQEGGGGGGYSGGGGGGAGVYNPDFGGGGGGGGSYIDSSATAIITEESGVTIPDDPGYGEIYITAVPEPTTLAMAGLGGLSLILFRWRQRK